MNRHHSKYLSTPSVFFKIFGFMALIAGIVISFREQGRQELLTLEPIQAVMQSRDQHMEVSVETKDFHRPSHRGKRTTRFRPKKELGLQDLSQMIARDHYDEREKKVTQRKVSDEVFTYSFNGQDYEVQRRQRSPYAIGSTFPITVDPKRPDVPYLRQDLTFFSYHFFSFGIMGMGFMLATMISLFNFVAKRKDKVENFERKVQETIDEIERKVG